MYLLLCAWSTCSKGKKSFHADEHKRCKGIQKDKEKKNRVNCFLGDSPLEISETASKFQPFCFERSHISRGNKRAVCERAVFGECALVPVCGVQEYQRSELVSARVALQGKTFWRKLRYRGTSAKTTLWETTLL